MKDYVYILGEIYDNKRKQWINWERLTNILDEYFEIDMKN